jgi:protoporphyrinogen/coproporphyrinogen III oxidase
VHEIYAADSRQLSVRAAFPALRESEARGNGSVVWGELGPPAWSGEAARQRRQKLKALEEDENWDLGDPLVDEWEARVRAAALSSFRDGMETLIRALVEALKSFPYVTLRSGTVVRKVNQEDDGSNSFQVRATSSFCTHR